MRFRALGPVAVDGDGQLQVLGGKGGRILATLLANAGSPVSADRLIDAAWGEHPPKSVRNALQVHISKLRTSLPALDNGSPPLRTTGNTYTLDVSRSDIDIWAFEDAVAAARNASEPGERATRLRNALALWRGRPFEPWDTDDDLRPLAVKLDELRLEAEELLGEADLEAGRHLEVIDELRANADREPLRERRWEGVMLALYRSGRQAEALRTFQHVRQLLGDELGIEPGPGLVALEDRILLQDPTLQLDAPASATRSNVIAPPDDLIGRGRELADLTNRIISGRRLITLHGPGGIGKTRLAIGAALDDQVMESFEQIAMVELEAIDSTADVEAAAVRAVTGGDDAVLLTGAIGNRRVLLVLDNCEHVIDGVRTVTSAVLAECPATTIIATSRLPLAISGETQLEVGPLEEPASELFEVRARDSGHILPPDSDDTLQRIVRTLDGIPLAIELAAARLTVLSLDELADRLNRPAVLRSTVGEPGRHSSVEDAVAWSHDLLDGLHQRAFAWLSVFKGGFTAGAAEHVLSSISPEPVLTLSGLHDAALVVRSRGRLRILEPIRQFAESRLADLREHANAADRLDSWVEQLAATNAAPIGARHDMGAIESLRAERANIEEALGHLDGRDSNRFTTVISDLCPYWWRVGDLHTGDRWAREAAELDAATPKVLRYSALFASRVRPDDDATSLLDRLADMDSTGADTATARAHVAWARGDMVDARSAFEAAAAVQRASHDPELVDTLLALARMRIADGYPAEAAALADELVTMGRAAERADAAPLSAYVRGLTVAFTEGLAAAGPHFEAARIGLDHIGMDRQLVGVLRALSLAQADAGEWGIARENALASLERARLIGDSSAEVYARMALGLMAAEQGDVEVATGLLDRALRQAAMERDQQAQSWCLFAWAVLAMHSDQIERSATLLAASDTLVGHWSLGAPSTTWRRSAPLAEVLEAQLGMDFEQAYAAGTALSAEAAVELALGYPIGWLEAARR